MKWRLAFIALSVVSGISCNTNATWRRYGGEAFPIKYLSPEESIVTSADVHHYIKYLHLPLKYFLKQPLNDTDVNTAFAAFYTKSLLKRTIMDDGSKLHKDQMDSLKKLIFMCEDILSHYIHINSKYGWGDMEFRISKLFVSDESQIYSIGDFNRDRIRRWIITKHNNMHRYLQDMDMATLPKEKYVDLVDENTAERYHIDMYASDHCISITAFNDEPIHVETLRKCIPEPYCEKRIYSNPSLGYYLSHRLLNVYFRHSRRCYMRSVQEDAELMERVCATMYRESVYLARRGYFARDLFLEHLSLCAMLGYEEFHRKSWFYKAASWINERGCVVEHKNYVKNRTKMLKRITDVRRRREYIAFFCGMATSECDEHPTALLMTVLAHAIRHAATFMKLVYTKTT